MPERITDKAWQQIVAATISGGTRGKVFRMSPATRRQIAAERRTSTLPTALYGVWIELDSFMRDSEIVLEER